MWQTQQPTRPRRKTQTRLPGSGTSSSADHARQGPKQRHLDEGGNTGKKRHGAIVRRQPIANTVKRVDAVDVLAVPHGSSAFFSVASLSHLQALYQRVKTQRMQFARIHCFYNGSMVPSQRHSGCWSPKRGNIFRATQGCMKMAAVTMMRLRMVDGPRGVSHASAAP